MVIGPSLRNNPSIMTSASHSGQPSISATEVLMIVWRRLWVIVLVLIFSLGAAFYVSRKTPRRWRATAEMILVQRAPSTLASMSPGQAPAGQIIDSPETQIALLQSYEMARKTIDWLKNDALAHHQSPDAVSM